MGTARERHRTAEPTVMQFYLISLGDQESEQDNEEQNTQTADEFNFDNAYAEYLND